MSAKALLSNLSRRNIGVDVCGDELKLSAPKGTITPDLLAELRPQKAGLIAELKRCQRRDDVLMMLADNPGVRYTFTVDAGSDPVIVAMGIRDLATFELAIPADCYAPFAVLQLFEAGEA